MIIYSPTADLGYYVFGNGVFSFIELICRLPDEELYDESRNYRGVGTSKDEIDDEDEAVWEVDVTTNETGDILYHCHTKETRFPVDWNARKTLVMASILCLLFMLAEIVGTD